MLIKAISCILIIFSSTMIGIMYANKKKNRLHEIRKFITAFNLMQIEIKFSQNKLPEILEKVGLSIEENIGQIFRHTKLKLHESNNIEESFKVALEYYNKEININESDKNIILDSIKTLGETDVENQIKNLNLGIEMLKMQEKDALEDTNKYSKMYKSLGVSMGIGLVIFLI